MCAVLRLRWRSFHLVTMSLPAFLQYVATRLVQAALLVPTAESVAACHMLNLALLNNKPALLLGPVGSGKSAFIEHSLSLLSDAASAAGVEAAPSATSNAAQAAASSLKCLQPRLKLSACSETGAGELRDAVLARLVRRPGGALGPAEDARVWVFVDDLHAAAVNATGARPAAELIRQWLDTGAWCVRSICRRL